MKLGYKDYAAADDLSCLGKWCLLFGAEHRLKRDALARMREESAALGPDASYEVLDGPGISARELLNRCQTGALFGGARLVVVQRAERLPAEEQDVLAKAVGELPADVSLILVTSETGERGRRQALRAALQRAIERSGLAIEFRPMRAAEASAWAAAQAKARGKKLEPAAARKLADQKIGADLAELESEVEKLCLFVGDAPTITTADVDVVTPRLIEEDIFRLIAAVGERQPGRAVAILRPLLRDRREDPGRVLGLLAQTVRLIWQTKLLVERGWQVGQDLDEETDSLLPQDRRRNALAQFASRPWLAQRTMRQAKHFSWGRLRRALEGLQACDLAIKSIRGKVSDPALALELLVVQLCADVPIPAWESPAGEQRLG